MLRRADVLALALLLGASCARGGRPNIVLMIADDLGYGELGSYGQRAFATPHLDRLAAEGMRFTDFYAGSSICAASRCALMTGKHTGHATIRGNAALRPDGRWERVPLALAGDTTIAELLREAGYATALFGKWHLESPGREETWAHRRGFQTTLHYQWGEPWEMDEERRGESGAVLWETGRARPRREVTQGRRYPLGDDLWVDRALDFARAHRREPLFVVLSFHTPHPPEALLERSLYADRGWPEVERRHAARITLLDREVGRLVEGLAALGLDERTLYLFTSDNGPHSAGGHSARFFASGGGLRGIKEELYEGGIRVPLIARWTGRIAAGTVAREPAAFWDLLPTLTELAGARTPAGLDGVSLAPVLRGEPDPAREFLYWELQESGEWQHGELARGVGFHQALRAGSWKLVRHGAGRAPIEIYDLATDPAESRDLAGERPEVVARLAPLLETARTDSPDFPYGGFPAAWVVASASDGPRRGAAHP